MSPFNEIQSAISLEWRENRWPGALFRADYSGCDAGAGELDPSPLTLLDDCWSCSFCSMGSPEHHSGLIHTEASRQFSIFPLKSPVLPQGERFYPPLSYKERHSHILFMSGRRGVQRKTPFQCLHIRQGFDTTPRPPSSLIMTVCQGGLKMTTRPDKQNNLPVLSKIRFKIGIRPKFVPKEGN